MDFKIRTTFKPSTMDEVANTFAAACGAECFVCRREPWPPGLTYKNLSICAPCAPFGPQREAMSELNETTPNEDAALAEGIDRAGEYLATLGKFDLRELRERELREFSARFLCGYSDAMRERTSRQPPF